MTTQCEDYPCCGHTDGLPCNWVAPDYSRDPHLLCDHEAGVCDVWEDEDDYCCEGDELHDGEAFGRQHSDDCDNYDGAPVHQWEGTEPAEVYMTDQGYEDRAMESALFGDC